MSDQPVNVHQFIETFPNCLQSLTVKLMTTWLLLPEAWLCSLVATGQMLGRPVLGSTPSPALPSFTRKLTWNMFSTLAAKLVGCSTKGK